VRTATMRTTLKPQGLDDSPRHAFAVAALNPSRWWEPWTPDESNPWDRDAVAHLHRRAGFMPNTATLERDLNRTPDEAIESLLLGDEQGPDGQHADDLDAQADQLDRRVGRNLEGLQSCWLHRMIHTARPLRERMTLFWHDHFATSFDKVGDATLMRHHIALLRRHALGRFGPLLKAIGRDPAMLIWLDSAANRKRRPNENYAREVMELFTLGIGHYTEADIQEAARAFTGRFVVNGRYVERPEEFDDRPKRVLGKTAPFDGDSLADWLLEQPACAQFLAAKLASWFLSDLPEDLGGEASSGSDCLAPLAETLRTTRYDLTATLRFLLRSRIFFDPAMRRRKVKSPVEFTVGMVRSLDLIKPTLRLNELAQANNTMGQRLFAPPGVAGWDGGPAWLGTTATLARLNFALALVGAGPGDNPFGRGHQPEPVAINQLADLVDRYADLWLQAGASPSARRSIVEQVVTLERDPTNTPADADPGRARARAALGLLVALPEFQLA